MTRHEGTNIPPTDVVSYGVGSDGVEHFGPVLDSGQQAAPNTANDSFDATSAYANVAANQHPRRRRIADFIGKVVIPNMVSNLDRFVPGVVDDLRALPNELRGLRDDLRAFVNRQAGAVQPAAGQPQVRPSMVHRPAPGSGQNVQPLQTSLRPVHTAGGANGPARSAQPVRTPNTLAATGNTGGNNTPAGQNPGRPAARGGALAPHGNGVPGSPNNPGGNRPNFAQQPFDLDRYEDMLLDQYNRYEIEATDLATTARQNIDTLHSAAFERNGTPKLSRDAVHQHLATELEAQYRNTNVLLERYRRETYSLLLLARDAAMQRLEPQERAIVWRIHEKIENDPNGGRSATADIRLLLSEAQALQLQPPQKKHPRELEIVMHGYVAGIMQREHRGHQGDKARTNAGVDAYKFILQQLSGKNPGDDVFVSGAKRSESRTTRFNNVLRSLIDVEERKAVIDTQTARLAEQPPFFYKLYELRDALNRVVRAHRTSQEMAGVALFDDTRSVHSTRAATGDPAIRIIGNVNQLVLAQVDRVWNTFKIRGDDGLRYVDALLLDVTDQETRELIRYSVTGYSRNNKFYGRNFGGNGIPGLPAPGRHTP